VEKTKWEVFLRKKICGASKERSMGQKGENDTRWDPRASAQGGRTSEKTFCKKAFTGEGGSFSTSKENARGGRTATVDRRSRTLEPEGGPGSKGGGEETTEEEGRAHQKSK